MLLYLRLYKIDWSTENENIFISWFKSLMKLILTIIIGDTVIFSSSLVY